MSATFCDCVCDGIYLGFSGCPQSIVLENLTQVFAKPNILDIKLGTVLYDEDATPEKKARMEKTARDTTSFETGMRLTGFQVHDLGAGVAVNTARSYGKMLKKDDLPDGIAKFFPASLLPSQPAPSPDAPPPFPASVETTTPTNGTGLPPRTLLPILRGIRKNVQEIRDAVAQVEMRMVGGSLLIIYEANWEKAEEGNKTEAERKAAGLDEDEEEDEDSDEDDEETVKTAGAAYVVKLIDFAHTFILPGRGADESLLTGMDTTLRLLKGRIEEVEALLVQP